MNKDVLDKYKKPEDKLLLSKVLDKSKFCIERNKIETTDFLDISQKQLVNNFLKSQKLTNYMFFGGFEEAERTLLIFYPDKLKEMIENNKFNFNTIISIIRIDLPSDLYGKYTHKNYLGGLIKLGIKREKIGDIIVEDTGADIIIHPDISKFINTNITELKRFSKSKIGQIKIEDLRKLNIQKEEINVTVSSMRLDNIVSELVKCSRNIANEILMQERVFINFEVNSKPSKEIKQNDLITIRGKGRFEIKEILGNTKKGRFIIKVEKYK